LCLPLAFAIILSLGSD
jgi:hypothetical protein